MNYYYEPNLYDLDYLERTEDVSFYIDKAKGYKNSDILELGSGTGRISVPIHKSGSKLTCIEKSPLLIKKAKEKCSSLNILNLDFTDFKLNKKFDLVIMPFNALQEVYNDKDLLNCLKCINKHLKNDGKFIFDVNNPNIDELNRVKDDVMVYDVFKAFYEDGFLKRYIKKNNKSNDIKNLVDVVVEDSVNYDKKSKIANYTMYYSSSDANFHRTFKLRHKVFFPKDLRKLIISQGFKIFRVYGDFNKTSFDKLSPSQIYTCKKSLD